MKAQDFAQKHFWSITAVWAVLLIGLLVFSPAEVTLGNVVKIVYLHGALERVSTYAYLAAAALGLGYLGLRRPSSARWTQGMTEVAIGLWVAEFIISLPAQWLAWGGITLSEPRVNNAIWIMGLTLAIYIVTRWMAEPAWLAFGAVANAAVLLLVLNGTANILHPFNPITGSDSLDIKLFYAAIVLTIAAASFLVVWRREMQIRTSIPPDRMDDQSVLQDRGIANPPDLQGLAGLKFGNRVTNSRGGQKHVRGRRRLMHSESSRTGLHGGSPRRSFLRRLYPPPHQDWENES